MDDIVVLEFDDRAELESWFTDAKHVTQLSIFQNESGMWVASFPRGVHYGTG